MDQQVPIDDLYQLADRYARGDKLPEWVEGFLAEELPGSLLSDLKAKRREVLRRRIFTGSGKTFEFPREDSANFGAEQPKPKRKTGRKKWTPEDPVVRDITMAYLAGEETYKQIAVRLGLSSEGRIVQILGLAYNAEDFAELKRDRRRVILGRKWAKQRGVPYRPEIVVEVLNGLIQAIQDPPPAVEK